MHLNANQEGNPYFPRSISCIGENENDKRTHGETTD